MREKNRKQRRSLDAAIRDEIARRGLTTGEVAKLAGMVGPNVSRWLHERKNIRIKTAEKLASALGITSGPM